MCGIFAISTSSGSGGLHAQQIREELLSGAAFLEGCDLQRTDPGDLKEPLEAVRQTVFSLLRPPLQAQLLQDESLRLAARTVGEKLTQWQRKVEAHLEKAPQFPQSHEAWNALLVTCRDLGWQLERDALQNCTKITELLSGGARSESAFTHAAAANLALNGLDRLEVRGRDSAGLTIYVTFAHGEARRAFLSEHCPPEVLSVRTPGEIFNDMSITAPSCDPAGLLFTYKVAEEVGGMGQNAATLREKISCDTILQAAWRAEGTQSLCLAHTRWASNGSISVANCHPTDSSLKVHGRLRPDSVGRVIAVLNGDIDNFLQLREELLREGVDFPQAVTTDAKIIPVLMAQLCAEGRDAAEAFRTLVGRLEGSFALCLCLAERPGEMFVAQKGSGQGLFVGFAGDTLCVASEVYGLVELTGRYVKLQGQREENGRTAGECFHLNFRGSTPTVHLLTAAGAVSIPSERFRRAEITTRDIHRGGYQHYLLKEINESVASVQKTLRGKVLSQENARRIHLGPEVLPPGLVRNLKGGHIRRIVAIGQGTAAVAATAVAHLVRKALRGAPLTVESAAATELSGHSLSSGMHDTLVVAISQSGTTTDTNRTVDLARARGATVLAIVNRRNSDLVFKAHGVLYTSDGRDIEMAVASTKAFYAQCVAGQLLALALGDIAGTLPPSRLTEEIEELAKLPAALRRTLRLSSRVKALAEEYAPRRRYWAVVGSGGGKIAADEIRIKLSELCYKAVAVDFLEDKKHIDLSSEPLIVVCATPLAEAQVADAVKEMAIFKAHNALPIVVTQEGEERFDAYAAGTVAVPRYRGQLGFLLPVMVGHLFGYWAAHSFERAACRLRELRKEIVQLQQAWPQGLAPSDRSPLDHAEDLVRHAVQVDRLLREGRFDSMLDVGTAVALSQVLQFLLARTSLDLLPDTFHCAGTCQNLLRKAEQILSAAVNEATRPIDAVKHQAKTVTVGISRLEEVAYEGPIWKFVEEIGLPKERLPTSVVNFVSAFGTLIETIDGATLYEVRKLGAVGQVTRATELQVSLRTGVARTVVSRCLEPRPLFGTKRRVVAERQPYLGFGQKDKRRILILPFVHSAPEGSLLLLHFSLRCDCTREERLAALRADRRRYGSLIAAVTEHDLRWTEELIDCVENDTLFLKTPEEAARCIVERHKARGS